MAGYPQLPNKPLVEAILELRWKLESHEGLQIDPHYSLLPGLFYGELKGRYPEVEVLPSSRAPEGVLPHVVRQRLRAGKDDWPLVQLGPGVLTVNDTCRYHWRDFASRVTEAVGVLHRVYPGGQLTPILMQLRYLDAIAFDYGAENVLRFLTGKLHVQAGLPAELLEQPCKAEPRHFKFELGLDLTRPRGRVGLGIATGNHNGQPAVVINTTVTSVGGDAPTTPEATGAWLEQAHEVTRRWFFTLIDGELKKDFEREPSA